MNNQKTCGPLYKEGLEFHTGMDPQLIPVFASGFVSGQAEKIYLGACHAAMFRPSGEWLATVETITAHVAKRYGLLVCVLPTSRGPEIWMCKSAEVCESISALRSMRENSPEWHRRRGLLCGVLEIDHEFHHRTGHNDPCDV